MANPEGIHHLVFVVANHFEPAWNEAGTPMDWDVQQMRLEHWCEQARATGRFIRDVDGMPFRHTYFYPAEQYHPGLLDVLAELQADGFGEVEIHLHHGVERPDTPESLRETLVHFRDALADKHRCLSRMDGAGPPMYAFVHGNWALANSNGGRFCGVDPEIEVLAETGCYADLTLPSAPDRSQVPRINALYECGRPLCEQRAHRCGPNLRLGHTPTLPILFTGPLIVYWDRHLRGVPLPRIDAGTLAANYRLDRKRFQRWMSARIGVFGRPDWVFIKLHCHGFIDADQDQMIGRGMRRFLEELLELADHTRRYRIYFSSAREAFNMIMAAIDGKQGEPGLYRDYRLRLMMSATKRDICGQDELHAR
jgi:hypothetical protein